MAFRHQKKPTSLGEFVKPVNSSVFRAYDIRGIVDRDFDPEWVERLGRALGAFFQRHGQRRALVGHDCRLSSPEYQSRLAEGLLATGMDVVLLNLVPTPVFYYAVKHLGFEAGVVITASHNPPEYNGFKIWLGPGALDPGQIQELCAIMAAGDFPTGRGVLSEHDIAPAYLDELAGQITLESPVKVALDGGNGAGGHICLELLRRVGAEVVPLSCEPDGRFPNHHPDPVVAENMAELMAAVPANGAACGLGLDGDADRLGVVDERGALLYGDRLTAILARDVLAANPGAAVIGEVKCTHLLYKDIEAHGGRPIMAVTGHSFMKAKLRETGALLAGEMSGHIIFADRYHGFDDGIYAAARVVELLSRHPGKPLSSWLDDWPRTVSTPEIRVDCPEEIKFRAVDKALALFREQYDIIDVDGVRVVFPDGWGLIRASNTQPVLVLRFEAESEARLAEIRELMETPLARIIKELRGS